MQMEKAPLLTKEKLAIKFNVSVSAIDRMLQADKIKPYMRVGKRLLFDPRLEKPIRKNAKVKLQEVIK
jgi:hypothetical protein